MLVRRGAGWALRAARRARGPGRPRRPRPRRPGGARPRRRPRPRARRPVHPLGIEGLPAGEAEPLLAAYHEGVRALPDEFGAWAAVGLAAPDPAELARLLDAGFVGACIAAERARRPRRLRARWARCSRRSSAAAPRCSSIPAPRRRPPPQGCRLVGGAHRLRGRDADGVVRVRRLGPRRRTPGCASASRCSPAWRRCTRERLLARGGPAISDPGVFLDVSSYGDAPSMRSCARSGSTGWSIGSDRPVVPARRAGARRRRAYRAAPAQPGPTAALHRRHGGPRMTTILATPRSSAISTRASCAIWSAGSPPIRGNGARSCAATRRSATSSSCGATTTSTSGSSPGPTATTPASTTTTSRAAPSRSCRVSSSRSASSWAAPPRQLAPPSRRDVRLRRVARPPDAPGRATALGRHDPRLLAAAVAHGRLRGRRRRHAAPPVDLHAEELRPVETAA